MHLLDQLGELAKPQVEPRPWMSHVEMILGTVDMLEDIAAECIAAGRCALDLETTGLDQRAFPMDNGQLVTVDKIVGYCIAPSTSKGYYIPVRHQDKGLAANVPPRLVADMVRKIQEGGCIFVFHNAKFDHKFLQYDITGEVGSWDDWKGWDDTLILAYLRNSRQRSKGLKFLSKEELQREMIELKELFPADKVKAKNLDFSTLDPTWEPVVWYAAADAINTLALYEILAPGIMNRDKCGWTQSTVYQIEKMCSTATRWMEQCRIFIDREKLISLLQLGQKEWWDCLLDVYRAVGDVLKRDVRPGWIQSMTPYDPTVLNPNYMKVRASAKLHAVLDSRSSTSKSVPSLTNPKIRESVEFPPSYDITIPAEFGLMLRELGVAGLVATDKSKQVKTSKDVLEKVLEEAGKKHPWMRSVKRFRKVAKALGTVLFNIYRDTSPLRSPDGCVWVNFNGTKVDTGRFSTPTPRDKKAFHGQANWNVQSTTASYYDPKDPPPECVYRQREVVVSRPGYTLFAVDFSGVELRIVTNISKEPKWLAEFFRCSSCENKFPQGILPPPFCPKCGSDKIGDLHSLTTVGIYGEKVKADPKLFKLKRQNGKIVNFLLCYGGSGNAVMRATGVGKNEGWRIKNQFDKTYRGLIRWWGTQEKDAKKQLYVTTSFGRKYPVPDIVSEIRRFRSKAKRNAVNGPVQGTSADIMKLAMGYLYLGFKRKGWICRGVGLPDLILMTISIHDELVFEIHDSIVAVAIPVIEDIMCNKTVAKLKWIVPLKVDIEFGHDWTVPNNLTEMTWNKGGGKWTPKLVGLFPDRYSNYLQRGGVPIDVDSATPQPSQLEAARPALTTPTTAAATPTSVVPTLATAAPTSVVPTLATATRTTVTPTIALPAERGESKPPPSLVRGSDSTAQGREKTVIERVGDVHVYKIASHRMTPANAERLARVVSKCIGRGVDQLRVCDDAGNDLLGRTVKVALEEFKVILGYEEL